MTMQLHLQQVPAGNGRLWIRHGFKVFRRQPLAFSGLLGLALFASMLLGALPFIGPVLGLMAIPVCSLGFMTGPDTVLPGRSSRSPTGWATTTLPSSSTSSSVQRFCGNSASRKAFSSACEGRCSVMANCKYLRRQRRRA